MKTIIVGDLHGRYEIAEKVLASGHNVVFVGDYVDSRENRSVEDQIKTIEIVLNGSGTIRNARFINSYTIRRNRWINLM